MRGGMRLVLQHKDRRFLEMWTTTGFLLFVSISVTTQGWDWAGYTIQGRLTQVVRRV
jgi:hypothetical protein